MTLFWEIGSGSAHVGSDCRYIVDSVHIILEENPYIDLTRELLCSSATWLAIIDFR